MLLAIFGAPVISKVDVVAHICGMQSYRVQEGPQYTILRSPMLKQDRWQTVVNLILIPDME